MQFIMRDVQSNAIYYEEKSNGNPFLVWDWRTFHIARKLGRGGQKIAMKHFSSE